MWQQIILKANDLDRFLESIDELPDASDVAVFASTSYPVSVLFSKGSFDKISRLVPLLKDYNPEDIPEPELLDEINWKLIYGSHSF